MAEQKIIIEANCLPNPASVTTVKNDTVKFHNKSGSTCTITFPGESPFGTDKVIVIDNGSEKVKTVTLAPTSPTPCSFTTSCGTTTMAKVAGDGGGDGIIIVDPPPVRKDKDKDKDKDRK